MGLVILLYGNFKNAPWWGHLLPTVLWCRFCILVAPNYMLHKLNLYKKMQRGVEVESNYYMTSREGFILLSMILTTRKLINKLIWYKCRLCEENSYHFWGIFHLCVSCFELKNHWHIQCSAVQGSRIFFWRLKKLAKFWSIFYDWRFEYPVI